MGSLYALILNVPFEPISKQQGVTIVHVMQKKAGGGKQEILKKDKKKLAALRFRELNKHNEQCDYLASLNPGEGKVKCLKLQMMVLCPLEEGWVNVIPNKKGTSGNRGIIMPFLSPMAIGPVLPKVTGVDEHLPPAKNIENFHQGSKVFSMDLDDNGRIKPCFFETQEKWFADSEPHRHKTKDEDGHAPCLHNVKGQLCAFTYFESRVFYCRAMEYAFENDKVCVEGIQKLKEKLKKGYNLNICGYDAYKMGSDADSIFEAYCDATKPFGHERVLMAYLCLEKKDLPWRRLNIYGRPVVNALMPDMNLKGSVLV